MYSQPWTIVTTLLLTLCLVARVSSMRTQYVVMLDQTQYCDQCSDDQPCHGDNVTGADQVTQGLLWSLESLSSRNIINNDTIGWYAWLIHDHTTQSLATLAVSAWRVTMAVKYYFIEWKLQQPKAGKQFSVLQRNDWMWQEEWLIIMTFTMIIKIISHHWPLVPMLRSGNIMTGGGSVSNHR